MRRISARLLGSSSIDNSDIALLRPRNLARHRRKPFFLLRRVLGNLLVRVGEHLLVVLADRADVSAAPAAGDHARAAQDALPEVEAVLRAQQLLARGRVGFARKQLLRSE